MATERQIAANRANARRSTGPKTAAGKLRSSRNAFRHGLSGVLPLDLDTSTKVDAITRVLAGEEAGVTQATPAAEFAKAQVELLRIRTLRAAMLATIDNDFGNLRQLRHVAALDRYARYAPHQATKGS